MDDILKHHFWKQKLREYDEEDKLTGTTKEDRLRALETVMQKTPIIRKLLLPKWLRKRK